MNRRAFLSLLGMAGGAVALAPYVPKWVVYEPTVAKDAALLEGTAINLDRIMREVLRTFMAARKSPGLLVPKYGDGFHVGDDVPVNGRPVRLDQQFSIEIDFPNGCDVRMSDITIIGERLADEADRRGVTVFGDLEIPFRGIEAGSRVRTQSGNASMRGLFACVFDPSGLLEPMNVLRFDVLGGRA